MARRGTEPLSGADQTWARRAMPKSCLRCMMKCARSQHDRAIHCGSKFVLWISAAFYVAGFFVAFLLGPILARFDRT
jgi:hypothetical protein